MILWGTIVNALAIIGGSLLGLLIPNLKQGIRTTVMQGLGMAVAVLGISMTLKTENFLIVVGSLVLGGILGEWIGVDKGLDRMGMFLERRLGGLGKGKVAEGFVTTTLIYCVGAMAILGSIDSGMRGNHDILYTKSMLDGFSSIIFASTLGVGVLFSSIPVFVYQGSIALASTFITSFVSEAMLNAIIAEVTAVGGVLILGIGLNVLEIKKINVANLLPSVVVAAMAVPLLAWLG